MLLLIHKIKLGPIANDDTIYTAGYMWKLILEILINILFIPPYLESYFYMNGAIYVDYDYTKIFNTTYLNYTNSSIPNETVSISSTLRSNDISVKLYYNIGSMITFFMLFRIYHFFRLIHTFSYWSTPRATNICKLMNTQADVGFGIRAYLKIRPFISLLFGVTLVILIFGVAAYMFEYYNSTMINLLGVDSNSTNPSFSQTMQKFSNIYNSLWLILVSMTTIGYGDIFPTTYFGRLIAILACIFGTFILSLLVVFLNNSISFDEIEKHVYNKVVEEQSNPISLKKEAMSLVSSLLRYNYLKKNRPSDSALDRLYLWIEMKYNAKKFKTSRITQKKVEIDIDGILNNIKYHIENGVITVKTGLENYNKEKIIVSLYINE